MEDGEVAARCRQQLASFRIRELKDVLARLGLPKQGKKQVLMDRILAGLVPVEKTGFLKGVSRTKNGSSREDCAAVIEDIYRKLRGAAGAELASAGKKDGGAGSSSAARSEEADETANWGEAKTRCPCGNSKDQGTMIQCDDSKCGVWQHMSCVVIPEKPNETNEPDVPSQFYCELCRISRSDPFCSTLHNPLLSTKLSANGVKTEGNNPLQNIEKTFQLSLAERDMLHKPNHDLQVWCLLLNDKVPFRMHWPAYADLRINGVSVRVTNRPGQQLLGANGRDEGPGITSYIREGLNRISFSAYDARPFCVGVRIIRRNSLQQIYAMIPDVFNGEEFEEALARVRRCINGGGQGAAEDGDDSDLEVVADSISVNLRCPMSGSRIKLAGRFKPCLHMGCFDLHTFVELNQRARKWQCPICLKNYSLENLIIDPFVSRVTTALKSHPEDVTEVEMKADGHWRPKVEGEKSHEQWRTPDGEILVANGAIKDSKPVAPLVPVKEEEIVSSHERDGSHRIGMKRSHDGQWPSNGLVKRLNGWASNNGAGSSQRPKPPAVPVVVPMVISRSTTATDSNEEGERSVNQEPSEKGLEAGHYMDDNEVSYPARPSNKGTNGSSSRPIAPKPAADVIVLSDTDEDEGDNLVLINSRASGQSRPEAIPRPTSSRPTRPLSLDLEPEEASENRGFISVRQHFPIVNSIGPAKVPNSLENGASSGGAGGSSLEATNFWPRQPPRQHRQPYNLFSTHSDLATSVSALHNSPGRPASGQAAETPVFVLSAQQQKESRSRSNFQFGSPTPSYSNSDCNGVGSDGGNGGSSPRDAPLQLFLPHQPARAQVQPSLQEPRLSSVEDVDNNWFSLSLGGSDSVRDPVPSKYGNYRTNSQAKGCGLDSLASRASEVLLGMNTNGTHTPAESSRLQTLSSPPYRSPVDSLSPVPGSPPHGRHPLSPRQASSPPAPRHRSPIHLSRHRHNYFRVDSDSE